MSVRLISRVKTRTMTYFPPHHYPAAAPPQVRRREIFVDYGSFGSTEFCEESSSWQSQRSRRVEKFCARTPTLPLIPPNDVPFPFEDICMGSIDAARTQLSREVEQSKKFQNWKKQGKYNKNLLQDADVSEIERELESLGLDRFLRKHWQKEVRTYSGPICNRFATIDQLVRSKTFLKEKYRYFPRLNSHYSNGCLGYLPSYDGSDKGVVVYPSGAHMTHLCMRNITIFQDTCRADPVLYNTDFQVSIQGIQTSRCHGRDFIGVLGDNQCRLYEAVQEDNGVKVIEIVGGTCDGQITSVYPSPYIPGEAVVATSERKVLQLDSQQSVTLVEEHALRFSCPDPWIQVYYGSTPRSFIISDRTTVQMMDMRSSRAHSLDIFALPYSKLYTKERVMASTSCGTLPYHLVASDFSLMLMDERFPKEPVLLWRPCLRVPPQYLQFLPNITQDGQEDIILVGCQRTQDVLCYPLEMGNAERPLPHGLGPPWRLSHIDDFPQFSGIRGSGADMIALDHRLTKMSLIGVQGISFKNLQGFTALQLSACGDLFYQTYRPGHYDDDRTCSAGLDSVDIKLSPEVQASCKEWLHQLQDLMDQTTLERNASIPHRRIDVSEMFSAINKKVYPHLGCFMCQQQPNHEVNDVGDLGADDDVCMACGCQLRTTRSVKDYTEKGHASLIGVRNFNQRLYNRIAGVDIEKYTDPYSQLLLKQWNDDDDDIRELILERDKMNIELKKKTQEREKKKQAEKESMLFKVPASVTRSPGSPESRKSGISKSVDSESPSRMSACSIPSRSVSSHRSVSSCRSQQFVGLDESTGTKQFGTFQRMSLQLEDSVKKLLEYDKSPKKRKREHVAGFGSMPQRPLQRTTSMESLFSQASSVTPPRFIATAKSIEDCLKSISDYESDCGENVKHEAIRNWVSAVEKGSNFSNLCGPDSQDAESRVLKQNLDQNVNSGDENRRLLERIGLSVQTQSPLLTATRPPSEPPGIHRLSSATFGPVSDPQRSQDKFLKDNASFSNSAVRDRSFTPQGHADPLSHSESHPADSISQQAHDNPCELVSTSQLGMFSQSSGRSVKQMPKSLCKQKKKPFVSGF